MPVAFRLPEPFAGLHLDQTLARLVARHEALRTHFAMRGDQVVQAVNPVFSPLLPCVDLSGLSPARQAVAARGLLAVCAQRPLALERAPLWRCLVLRLAADHQVLAWNIHHILSDGGSQEILLGELLDGLRALRLGQSAHLPPLPLQYADYAAWQHARLSGPNLGAQRAYWQQRLAGAPPLLELPTDRPRPSQISYRGSLQLFQLGPATLASLRDFAHRRGATPFMVALAAFAALLARLCRRQDIVVGTPMAHRTHREFEGIVGLFLNTLVLRFQLQPDWSVDELIAAVRRETLESFTHQDLPFDTLVEELKPERSLSFSPIFQVLFVYNQVGAASLEATPTPFDEQGTTAKFDLSLSMTERPEGLVGGIEYASDLFDAPTISRFKRHYAHLLEAMLAGESGPVARIALSDTEERGTLLQSFNAIPKPPQGPGTIPQRFQAIAAARADQPALWLPGAEEACLTYAELAGQVNTLAHHLRALGLRAETPVALCAPRNAQLVVAILAVLVAGGSYVPTDPAYPSARLAYTLEDGGISLVLAGAGCVPQALVSGRQMVALDRPQAWADQSREAPDVAIATDQLSHIIYTSGSTGKPTGVAGRHAATCARFDWMVAAFAHGQLEGVLAATSICFDLSVFELLGTLSAGGQVILAENALHYPGHPSRARVRLLNTVPSAARQLLEVGALAAPLTVNLAGEALPADLVAALQDLGLTVNNLYGPSEDTTYSTWITMDESHRQVPTIGRPLPGTRAYVTDADLSLAPLGMVGELCLGGAGLARGYYARPALTASRFVPDPFILEPGARLYRTGDLARWQHDGQLRFLGREDFQVKLRGFRIELGEIEVELMRQPEVRETAVLVANADQGPFLAALVVPSQEAFDEAALRARLATRLPHHLQPQSYLAVPSLPRTPNGKLDRSALHGLCEAAGPVAAKQVEPPRTALERAVAECFAAVLDRDPVTIGRDDDFFHLGGHSLLALALLTRIERRVGKAPALNTLFRGGSVAALAALLAPQAETAAGERIVLRAQGERAPLYLIHPIGGNLLCYRKFVAAQAEGFPIYGFQAPGLDGSEPPLTTVADLAARYLSQLADPSQPLHLAGWSFGGVVAQEMAHQWEQQGRSVASLTLLDSHLAPKGKRSTELAPLDLFARDLGAPFEKLPTHSFATLDEVITWAKDKTILPQDLAPEHAAILYAVFAANDSAWRHHQPTPIQAKATLITAGANCSPQHITAQARSWRPLFPNGLTHQTQDVTHEGLVYRVCFA